MSNEKISVIQPWFSLNAGEEAIQFYKQAFNADETYRLDMGDGNLVVRLSVHDATFWISSEPNGGQKKLLDGNIRMILITNEPEAVCAQAIKAGATEIFPVGEEHGWRLGRIADPFGLHWEIGYELEQ